MKFKLHHRLFRFPLKCIAAALVLSVVTSGFILALCTFVSLRDVSEDVLKVATNASYPTLMDRNGEALTTTYQNEWNVHDTIVLHKVPEFLLQAFVFAEDQRFYSHAGVDWLARVNAVKQNVQYGKRVRGASTISEQVIKMIHKRPRKLWSRWLEGFEAQQLESKLTKLQILEFYVNQVPYAAKRRGIVQGSRYYFGRDLSSLNEKEMLALAVMVRAPGVLHPRKNPEALEQRIAILHDRMRDAGFNALAFDEGKILQQELGSRDQNELVDVSHLARHIQKRSSQDESMEGKLFTTIDREVQAKAQHLLDQRLTRMRDQQVNNGGILVVDHQSAEILAWVVGFAGDKESFGGDFDAVTVKRQPGSTLKPFVYAGAMEKGWTAATMIDDSPLQQSVGKGMHQYHNYSRSHYGWISLREALANSLNIPAVKAAQFIGGDELLLLLQKLGIRNLQGHPNMYGDGLALGNGEISLFELVQAYSTLARMGNYKAISVKENLAYQNSKKKYAVFSEEVASIIGNILSDPHAREKEFGTYSILNFPYQTAVKTGTSSDYRDAWAVGYNDKYTVGVWMGNMDYQPMEKVTGSTGPAIVLRSLFNELNRHRDVQPLMLSRSLEKHRICTQTGKLVSETNDQSIGLEDNCLVRDEWFVPGTLASTNEDEVEHIRLRLPTPGLRMAMDPRIPDESEFFEFSLSTTKNIREVEWFVNDTLVATTTSSQFLWPLARGNFSTHARVRTSAGDIITTEPIPYSVQ